MFVCCACTSHVCVLCFFRVRCIISCSKKMLSWLELFVVCLIFLFVYCALDVSDVLCYCICFVVDGLLFVVCVL